MGATTSSMPSAAAGAVQGQQQNTMTGSNLGSTGGKSGNMPGQGMYSYAGQMPQGYDPSGMGNPLQNTPAMNGWGNISEPGGAYIDYFMPYGPDGVTPNQNMYMPAPDLAMPAPQPMPNMMTPGQPGYNMGDIGMTPPSQPPMLAPAPQLMPSPQPAPSVQRPAPPVQRPIPGRPSPFRPPTPQQQQARMAQQPLMRRPMVQPPLMPPRPQPRRR